MKRSGLASALLAVAVFTGFEGHAQPADRGVGNAPVGPGRGAGDRKVVGQKERTKGDPAVTVSAKTETVESVKAKSKTHRRGRPPRDPNPTLPDDAPRLEVKDSVRRSIAQGPTSKDLTAGKDDPELQALREAELVLFPRPLDGVQPGWTWELPRPPDEGLTVSATGVPLRARLEPSTRPVPPSPADAKWLESLTMPNLPVRLDARVVKYLKFYRDSAKGRAIARVWAKKSGKYTPALKAELAKQGLPTDLVWLSLIESGHNPTIKSPAAAAGLWQFIPESGRMYGLTVDRWVDERLDPQSSTRAAARFLSDLYQRFGSWELAMAAYNMGYGGMSRAVKKYNTNDFWELSRHEAGVPWETTLYVPKIMAIAIVMNNKKAFGIDGVTPDEPVKFDVVRVKSGISLSRVAAAAEVSLPEIESANPHLLASRVPPSASRQAKSWPIRVPYGKGVVATKKLLRASGPGGNLEPYVVRFGDTCATVAKERRTSEKKLRRLNGLDSGERLRAGTILLVPHLDPGMKPGKTAEEVTVVSSSQFRYTNRRRVFYIARRGDRLEDIATVFGVSRSELIAWNAVDPDAKLQSGMALQIFVPRRVHLDGIRHTAEAETKVLIVGTDEFFDHFEGLKGKKRLRVIVKQGDTLRSIGKTYGMSVGWMERVNRRSRRDVLTPGDTVVVYASRGSREDPRAQVGPVLNPLPAIQAPHPEALPARSP